MKKLFGISELIFPLLVVIMMFVLAIISSENYNYGTLTGIDYFQNAFFLLTCGSIVSFLEVLIRYERYNLSKMTRPKFSLLFGMSSIVLFVIGVILYLPFFPALIFFIKYNDTLEIWKIAHFNILGFIFILSATLAVVNRIIFEVIFLIRSLKKKRPAILLAFQS